MLPCYNGERYLAQSIQSVIDQTYRNWELILVDDCSTDNSPRIMTEFQAKDSRIRIIRNQTNLKLPASLNAGFAQARGEYFTWTSDDNYYLPEALEELLCFLQDNNADMVYSGHYVIDDNGCKINEFYPLEPETLLYSNYTKACFLYKKEIHEILHGYDTSKFLVEDYDFWLRMYIYGYKMIILNKLLYNYRKHEVSLSSKRRREIIRTTYQVVIQNKHHFDKFPRQYQCGYWYYLLRNIRYSKKIDCIFLLRNTISIIKSGALVKAFRKISRFNGN